VCLCCRNESSICDKGCCLVFWSAAIRPETRQIPARRFGGCNCGWASIAVQVSGASGSGRCQRDSGNLFADLGGLRKHFLSVTMSVHTQVHVERGRWWFTDPHVELDGCFRKNLSTICWCPGHWGRVLERRRSLPWLNRSLHHSGHLKMGGAEFLAVAPSSGR